jgi:Domain of unknown function (DUF4124)
MHHLLDRKSTCWLSAALLATFLCAQPVGAQTVYKWTDEGGVVHFSDVPPPAGQKYEERKGSAETSTGGEAPEGKQPAATPEAPGSAKEEPFAGPARVIVTRREAVKREAQERHLIGEVKNVGGEAASGVGVTARITDSQGGDCGSEEVPVLPSTLDPGQTGNFDSTVNSPCFIEGGNVDVEAHWQ